jgi:hypothetical protein
MNALASFSTFRTRDATRTRTRAVFVRAARHHRQHRRHLRAYPLELAQHFRTGNGGRDFHIRHVAF